MSEIRSYDNFAEKYCDCIDNKSYNRDYERYNVLKMLHNVKGKTVLDLGCGSGFYSEYALKNGAKRVISIDASEKMAEITRQRTDSKTEIFVKDLSRPMDYIESDSIDIIICSLIIHYIEDWTIILSEMKRVLKKGGQLIITTHHPFIDYDVFNKENYFSKRIVGDEWDLGEFQVKVSFYVRPLSESLQSIVKSGLKIVSIDEPMPDPNLKNINEKLYKRLTTTPGFLFFDLTK